MSRELAFFHSLLKDILDSIMFCFDQQTQCLPKHPFMIHFILNKLACIYFIVLTINPILQPFSLRPKIKLEEFPLR